MYNDIGESSAEKNPNVVGKQFQLPNLDSIKENVKIKGLDKLSLDTMKKEKWNR